MNHPSQRRRARVLCAAVLLGLPAVASAQTGRLVGRVLDAETGQPLVNVQVFTTGPSEGAVGVLTSMDGRYVLRDVPRGFHEVTAQMIGYGTKVVTDVEIAQGRTSPWTSCSSSRRSRSRRSR